MPFDVRKYIEEERAKATRKVQRSSAPDFDFDEWVRQFSEPASIQLPPAESAEGQLPDDNGARLPAEPPKAPDFDPESLIRDSFALATAESTERQGRPYREPVELAFKPMGEKEAKKFTRKSIVDRIIGDDIDQQAKETAKAINQMWIDSEVRKHGRKGAMERFKKMGAEDPWLSVFTSGFTGGESRNMLAQLMSPLSRYSAKTAGSLAKIMLLGSAIKPAMTKLGETLNLGSRGIRLLSRFGGSAATMGASTAADILTQVAEGKDISVWDATKAILSSAGFGLVYAVAGEVTGKIASPFARIPAEAATGYVAAKLTGGDDEEAALMALTFVALGILHSPGRNLTDREFAWNRFAKHYGKYMERTKGIPADKAEAMFRKLEPLFRKDAEKMTLTEIDNIIRAMKNDAEIYFITNKPAPYKEKPSAKQLGSFRGGIPEGESVPALPEHQRKPIRPDVTQPKGDKPIITPEPVRATFAGWQEQSGSKEPIPLFNIQGGELDKSTISLEKLEKSGIPVPDYPPFEGQSTKGKGQSTKGKGESVKGKGESVKGKGESVKGKGESTEDKPKKRGRPKKIDVIKRGGKKYEVVRYQDGTMMLWHRNRKRKIDERLPYDDEKYDRYLRRVAANQRNAANVTYIPASALENMPATAAILGAGVAQRLQSGEFERHYDQIEGFRIGFKKPLNTNSERFDYDQVPEKYRILAGYNEGYDVSFDDILEMAQKEMFEYAEGLRDKTGELIDGANEDDAEAFNWLVNRYTEDILSTKSLDDLARLYDRWIKDYGTEEKLKAYPVYQEIKLTLEEQRNKLEEEYNNEYQRLQKQREEFFNAIEELAAAEASETESLAKIRSVDEQSESEGPPAGQEDAGKGQAAEPGTPGKVRGVGESQDTKTKIQITDEASAQTGAKYQIDTAPVVKKQTETPEFRQWFGKSKVVDKDGKPLVVYHGSPNQFNIFKFDNIGSQGTTEGMGFYFTPDKEIAKGYSERRGKGKLFEVYLKIENPASNEKRTISKSGLRKILLKLYKYNPDALSNYGDVDYYGLNKVLEEAVEIENYAESDTDLIGSLINGGIGSIEEVLSAVYETTGKDGVITSWGGEKETPIMVAFFPNQIKSATENIGTFDPNNPDIRFQKGISGQSSQKEQIAIVRELLPEVAVKAVDRIKVPDGREALGMYLDGVISIAANPKETTGYHEVVHGYLDMYIDPDERQRIFDDYRRKAKAEGLNDDEVEDRIAEEFYDYYQNAKQPRSFLRKLFEKIKEIINRLLGRIDRVKDLYDSIVAQRRPKRASERLSPALSYQERVKAPVFFSRAERVVQNSYPSSMKATAVINWLIRNNVKPDELEWLDIESLIKGKERITKEEIQDWIRANDVQVQEVVKGGEDSDNTDKVIDLKFDGMNVEVEIYNSAYPKTYYVNTPSSEISEEDAWDILEEAGIDLATVELDEYEHDFRRFIFRKIDDTKYKNITEPGGENYRELLLTMPDTKKYTLNDRKTGKILKTFDTNEEAREYYLNTLSKEEGLNTLIAPLIPFDKRFKSPHFDEPSILAHVRFNERMDADGNKVLFIEEIQSDWAQKGKRKGFKPKSIDELTAKKVGEPYGKSGSYEWEVFNKNGYSLGRYMGITAKQAKEIAIEQNEAVPNMPFKSEKSWSMLVFKRMIRWAAEQGFDKIAWTTGEMQAERYDLSKYIKKVEFSKTGKDRYEVDVIDIRDENVTRIVGMPYPSATLKQIENYLGKDIANKIENRENGIIETDELKVGGKGMRTFYDQKIPAWVKKYVKKWGSEVKQSDVITDKNTVIDADIFYDQKGFGIRRGVGDGEDGHYEYWTGNEWSADESEVKFYDMEREAKEAKSEIEPQEKMTVPSIVITPEMRGSVLYEGQPKFQRPEKMIDKTVDWLEKQIPKGKRGEIERHYEATLLRQKIAYIKRGYRMGKIDKDRELRWLQKTIKNYAKKHLPQTNMTRGQVVPVMTDLERARTIRDIEDAWRRIDEIRTKVDRKTTLEKVMDLIDKYQPKTNDKNRRIGTTLTPIEYAKMTDIKRLVQMKPGEVADFIQQIAQRAVKDDREPDPDEREAIYLANVFGDLRHKGPDEIQNALDEIKHIIETGRSRHRVMEEKRRELNRLHINKVIENITGGKWHLTEIELRAADLDKKKYPFRTLDDYQLGLESLLDKLERFDKNSGMNKGWVTRYYTNKVHESRNAETKGCREAFEYMNKKLEEIYGVSGRKLSRILDENTERIKTKILIEQNGKMIPLEISQNEAYKLWQWWQDPTLHEKRKPTDETVWEKMGIDETLMHQIENFMKPEVRAWAEWQLKEFYPKYYHGVNEVFKEQFYVDLPFNPFYSPITRDVKGEREEDQLLQAKNQYASVMSGHLKNRVRNNQPLKLRDGDNVLVQHILEMEHFKAWAGTIREMRAVLQNNAVQKAIRQYHGRHAADILNKMIDDLARGGIDRLMTFQFVDKLRANFVKAVIGLNPVTMYKQLMSIPAYAAEMPVAEWIAGISKFLANPVKALRILGESEMIKARYKIGWERDVVAAMHRGTAGRLADVKKFSDMVMWFTKFGDRAAIYFGGYPVYDYTYRQQIKLKRPEDMARKIAMREFEKATARAQQDANIQSLSHIQRGGSWAKHFTMFMTSKNQYYRQTSGAFRNLREGRGPVTENLKRIIIFHFLLPMLFQWAADGFKIRKKRQLRAAILGSLNGLFILGDALDTITRYMTGERWDESLSIPVLDPISNYSRAFRRIYRMIEDDKITWEEVLKAVDKIAKGTGKVIGVPYEPVKREVKNVHDYVTGKDRDIRRLMGYSEYSLRSDEKKGRKSKVKDSTRARAYRKLIESAN